MKKRHYKNHFGRAFGYGALTSLILWLYFHNFIPYVPNYFFAKIGILVFYATFSILTLGITFLGARQKRAVFDSSLDGFIIGVEATFTTLAIVIQVFQGQFPFSINAILI